MKKLGYGRLLVIVGLVASFASCATSQKVQVVQTGDRGLGCGQLAAEMRKLDAAQKQVNAKKGGTGTNKAAAAIWLRGCLRRIMTLAKRRSGSMKEKHI